MIGALEGKVIRIRADRCWLHVGGVAYVIGVGASLAAELAVGQDLFVWIATTVHDGQTSYFGFQTQEAEVWFYQLIAVSGVGGKVAMAILSALPPDALALAVVNQETSCLRAVDGVGPKLVARLLTEMKAFAHKWTLDSRVVCGLSSGDSLHPDSKEPLVFAHQVRHDAVQGLVALGYRRLDVERVVAQVLALGSPSGAWKAPSLVTKALALLTHASSE